MANWQEIREAQEYALNLRQLTGEKEPFFLGVLPVFRNAVTYCLMAGISQNDTIVLCFTLYCEWQSEIFVRMIFDDFDDFVRRFIDARDMPNIIPDF